MSEKAEQNAPERCSCCTCGYTWVKGQHGGHSCAQVMEVTVADLRAELAALKAQPSGVVLPGPIEAGEHDMGEYGNAMKRGYEAFRRAFLRLNSPPVSAGGVDERE